MSVEVTADLKRSEWEQTAQQLPETQGPRNNRACETAELCSRDRQWEEQEREGWMQHQKLLQTQPTINPFVEETLAGGGNSSDERTLG